MSFRTFSALCGSAAPHSAGVVAHQIFFIAFLDELGNFKPFETYFFLAILGKKSQIWRSGARQ